MPPVAMIQDDPDMLAGVTVGMPPPLNEWPLPPVIVTEKGESLDEFVARSAPDFFTALQVPFTTLPLHAFAALCLQPHNIHPVTVT